MDLAEARYGLALPGLTGAELVPFSAQTRMSGVDLAGRQVRKGAAESVRRWVADAGGVIPDDLAPIVEGIAAGGGTPLLVADGPRVLNITHLTNPHTAILAAVIYNALIIPALIPLALRGVKFRPLDGAAILRRNGLIYGVGGIIAPFVFIKLIDLVLTALGLH